MQVRLLGPIDIVGDRGEVIVVSAAKQRSLLALLAISANEPVSVDRAIDALWPDDVPASARNLVQGYIGKLRHAVGADRLSYRAGCYRLELTPAELDVSSAEQLIEMGQADAALDLWRGDALTGVDDEPWAIPVARRLAELRLRAQQERAAAQLDQGRARDAITDLEILVAEHPLDEHLYALLMRALYLSGRQADALRTFQRAREVLLEELGVDPGPELRDVEAAILHHDDALAPIINERRPPAARPPVPIAPIVGRVRELTRLDEALRQSRLVSIVGPGGVGKTRLALERCRRAGPSAGPFVDLATVQAPMVDARVAEAFGLAESADLPWAHALVAYLADAPVEVVLDNAEHVLEAAAALVASLLDGCENVRIVCTSREPLGLLGEVVIRLDGLEPAAAAALFIDRAQRLDANPPDQALTDAIVERVDYLPLAIELAASQLDVLAPAQLSARLDDQLSILVGPGGPTSDRHRTMRATIDWSYQLLSEPERYGLERLAVFAGSFTLAGADAVVGTPAAELVTTLLRQSMLVRAPDLGDEAAYRMLEPIKQYAMSATESTTHESSLAALDRHLDETAMNAVNGVRSDDASRWMATIRSSAHDLRRSIARRSLSPDGHLATLVADLYWPWFLDGHLRELLAWTADALATPIRNDRLEARLWWARSAALIATGDLSASDDAAVRQLDAAERASDRELAGLAHSLRGMVAWAGGAHEHAMPRHRRAVELVGSTDETWTLALVSALAGRSALALGEVDEGARLLEHATVLAEEIGEPMVLGSALDYRAAFAYEQGEHDAARELAERGLRAYRGIGYREGMASALSLLGTIAVTTGDANRATEVLGESLALSRRLQHVGGTASALEGLAQAAVARDEDEVGRRLLAEAADLRSRSGIPVPTHLQDAVRELTRRLGG